MNYRDLLIRINHIILIKVGDIADWWNLTHMTIYADANIRASTPDRFVCLDCDGSLTGYFDPAGHDRDVKKVCEVSFDNDGIPTVYIYS